MHTSLPINFKTVEEVRERAGTPLGHSSWFDVSQETIDGFAAVTGDYEWIHVDRQRAALGPYGITIAHGYLTLALAAKFVSDVIDFEFSSNTLNYGVDRVRFPAPLLSNSRVRSQIMVNHVKDHPKGHIISLNHVMTSDTSTIPVAVIDALLLVMAR